MKRLAAVTLTLLFLIPFGAATASPADLNINGDQLRAEADAQQRAEFDACMAELQSGATSLQLCMPQWAPAPSSTTTSTTRTMVTAVEESADIPDEGTRAPTTTAPAKPAPTTTTTVPAADPPADDGHGYDYEPPELGDDEFYIVPVEGTDEVALIPVPVGDCLNDRWSEQGIDPTHPEFSRLLAEFFAANLGPCMEEHGF
jgi:hypothetical protein